MPHLIPISALPDTLSGTSLVTLNPQKGAGPTGKKKATYKPAYFFIKSVTLVKYASRRHPEDPATRRPRKTTTRRGQGWAAFWVKLFKLRPGLNACLNYRVHVCLNPGPGVLPWLKSHDVSVQLRLCHKWHLGQKL